jgi:putative spermidine/putrescine transport system permease protein
VLAYPVAYFLSTDRSGWRTVIFAAVAIPFWISILVRTYSWMIILGRYGPINNLLTGIGVVDNPLSLMYNRMGVYIGLVYCLLPYAVLPLASIMQGIDRQLLKAAGSLGSSGWQAFRRVFFPLSIPGVWAGFLLVFIMSAGFFITPTLMGGPRDAVIAMSIQAQLGVVNNWGFAGALSVFLLLIVLLLFYLCTRFVGVESILTTGAHRFYGTLSQKKSLGKEPLYTIYCRIKNLVFSEYRLAAYEKINLGVLKLLDKTLACTAGMIPGIFQKMNWRRIMMRVCCGAVCVFLILPVFVVFPVSFSDDLFLQFPPKKIGMGLFGVYFSSKVWMHATCNSLFVAVPVMLLATLMGTLASISLVRGTYAGKRLLYAFFLSPMIVPAIISAVSMYFFFAKLQLIGSITGLVLAHTAIAVPYVVIVMTSTLTGVDEHLEQASMSLGAGKIRTFFNVTFPLIRPGVYTALIFSFLASFDELIIALFISGVGAVTLPKQMWDGIRDEMNPVVAAVATILIALALVLMAGLTLYQRRQKYLLTGTDGKDRQITQE